MRYVFAPPHHYVVPSPYKQGESAIRKVLRMEISPLILLRSLYLLRTSAIQASLIALGLASVLLSAFPFPLHFHFRNHFPVKEAHDAVGIIGVVLGVGYHYDGCAFGVKLLEQVHYFCAVL